MSIEGDTLWVSLPVPAFVVTDADLLKDMNPAAEQFLNASAKSRVGQPVLDILAVDAPLESGFERMRKGHTGFYVNNVDVSGGNKAPVLCNIQISTMSDASGDILMLITPRQLSDRYHRPHSPGKAARSAIGMAEMLAHEIKNPLAGITGAAQLLSMNLSKKDGELTDLIVDEAKRIVSLLEQVETFGDTRPPKLSPVNLHDILDRARKSAGIGVASNMTIVEDFDPSLPLAEGDGDQLLQVFQNLLKNAAEAAGDEGGRIKLRTYFDGALRLRRRDGSGQYLPLQVEIIDDGPGLPDEISDDIFEPFVSGKENGTGLGLALVSKIVADHNGWIGVESVPGETVFKISLPMAGRAVQQSEETD